MMPKADADLEIDPDPQLEREADQAAEAALSDGPMIINRMGADMHIQRMPSDSQLEQAHTEADERFGGRVPADPEVLAEEVGRLKEGQEKIFETLTETKPGAADGGNWLTAAIKGTMGALAGAGAGAAIGAAAGSVVPAVGTATGAAVGAAVSGLASDVTKEGIDYLVDNRPESKSLELEHMYEEMRAMYDELVDQQALTSGQYSPGDYS